jgi:hypothetical protein
MESSDPSPKLYAPIEAAAQGAPAGCSARIITEPADAKIFWRGVLVGRSPIAEAKIPCGAGSFTVSHDRYETLTLPATLAPGAPFELDPRLHRPPAVLVVSSSPAGAGLTVNGHPFGSAPQRLDTWRYEQVTVRAALPGFLPWTKKLYQPVDRDDGGRPTRGQRRSGQALKPNAR